MNRRGFLSLFGAGVAGIALEQAIPLGRVWSFPKNIVLRRVLPVQLVCGADWAFSEDSVIVTRWRNHKGIHFIESIDRYPLDY